MTKKKLKTSERSRRRTTKREKGAAVRLEIAQGADPLLLEELLNAIELTPENVTTIDGPINLARLMSAYDLIDRPDLKFPSYTPDIPPDLENPEQIFRKIAHRDYLLFQPYDSFQPFIDFIQQADVDPQYGNQANALPHFRRLTGG